MATLKAVIKKDKMRADKTWNVLIRFTHKRIVRYISTTMYVERKDLTSRFNIKNRNILDKCDYLISEYRKRLARLNLEINDIVMDTIIKYITTPEQHESGIDFVGFSRRWINKHTEIKGVKNYNSALNSFIKFYGREYIPISEVTVQRMRDYEMHLSEKMRAQSMYCNAIVRLFNEAVDEYNDEDNDIKIIKHSLRKFKPKQQNVAEKRALTVEQIQRIFALPYSGTKVKGYQCRRDLAVDCFKLSFCLMGMNSADLYNATEYDGEYITYYRTKTKDRRNDKAKMVVRVHPAIKSIVDKYHGKDRVFNFYERFSSMADLNRSINIGLKEIGKEIGIDNLQYYAARHSMATIALNKVGINKYIVNDMLCHTDMSMKVTDLYIQKDYSIINDANFKLIDYILYNNV